MASKTTKKRLRTPDRPGILERLSKGPVLGDGGYLLELEKRGYVQPGPFTPECVLEHPEAVQELHLMIQKAKQSQHGQNGAIPNIALLQPELIVRESSRPSASSRPSLQVHNGN